MRNCLKTGIADNMRLLDWSESKLVDDLAIHVLDKVRVWYQDDPTFYGSPNTFFCVNLINAGFIWGSSLDSQYQHIFKNAPHGSGRMPAPFNYTTRASATTLSRMKLIVLLKGGDL